jgi:hypothetical protein
MLCCRKRPEGAEDGGKGADKMGFFPQNSSYGHRSTASTAKLPPAFIAKQDAVESQTIKTARIPRRYLLIKSGLGGDDLKTMNPLDVEGAKQLEQVSSNFQATAATKRRVAQQEKLRSKIMGHVDSHDTSQGQDKKASLEHMVKM